MEIILVDTFNDSKSTGLGRDKRISPTHQGLGMSRTVGSSLTIGPGDTSVSSIEAKAHSYGGLRYNPKSASDSKIAGIDINIGEDIDPSKEYLIVVKGVQVDNSVSSAIGYSSNCSANILDINVANSTNANAGSTGLNGDYWIDIRKGEAKCYFNGVLIKTLPSSSISRILKLRVTGNSSYYTSWSGNDQRWYTSHVVRKCLLRINSVHVISSNKGLPFYEEMSFMDSTVSATTPLIEGVVNKRDFTEGEPVLISASPVEFEFDLSAIENVHSFIGGLLRYSAKGINHTSTMTVSLKEGDTLLWEDDVVPGLNSTPTNTTLSVPVPELYSNKLKLVFQSKGEDQVFVYGAILKYYAIENPTFKRGVITKLRFLNYLNKLHALDYAFTVDNHMYWNLSPIFLVDPEDPKRSIVRLSALDGNGKYSGYRDFTYNRINIADYLSSLGTISHMTERFRGLDDFETIKNLIAQEFSSDEVEITEDTVDGNTTFTVTVIDPNSLLWYGSGSITVGDIPDISTVVKLQSIVLSD